MKNESNKVLNLLNPTREIVKEYVNKFDDGVEGINKNIIDGFVSHYGTSYDGILAVSALINTLYSTHIDASDFAALTYGIFKIRELKIRLNAGDIALVSEIAGLLKTDDEKKKEYISFASKFCAFHNESKFPIYDRISREMLAKINKEYHFTDKFNKDKIPYEKYVKIYDLFIEEFNLKELTYREVDKYLWLSGKEIKV